VYYAVDTRFRCKMRFFELHFNMPAVGHHCSNMAVLPRGHFVLIYMSAVGQHLFISMSTVGQHCANTHCGFMCITTVSKYCVNIVALLFELCVFSPHSRQLLREY
jgi:hypothetical protein